MQYYEFHTKGRNTVIIEECMSSLCQSGTGKALVLVLPYFSHAVHTSYVI